LVDVILYGSYARGEQESDSDIDVMVLVDERAERIAGARKAFSKLNSDIDLEYTFDEKYSEHIGSAFQVRNGSDYDDMFLVSRSDAVEQLEHARLLVTKSSGF
jgi:predicted nucleotidyltransferase